ncbi:acyltransferase [Terrarubrum flagellatum]|uniref:acyltransferase family protein n=1 Tax=Terrirubrum flagellatum TaxID=2895980 RepID=UPI003144F6F8
MSQIGSIQALRAVAAVTVAFGHLQHETLSMPAAALHGFEPVLLKLTGVGVDLFFVISGFVMAHASRDLFGRRDSARIFLGRRVARIVPLYWATTSLFALAMLLAPSALSSAPPTLAEIVKSYFFIPYADGGTGLVQPIYKLGWTLNFEMFFYVIFAGVLVLPRLGAIAAIVALMSGLTLFGSWLQPQPGPLSFWTHPIILEFALGMVIGGLRAEGLRLGRAEAWGIAASGCACLAIANLADPDVTGALRPLVWGAPAAMIVAAAALFESPAPRTRISSVFVALGDASYALYLLHPIAIRALRIIWDRSGASASLNPWIFIALGLAAAIIAAIIVHRLFEKPTTHVLQRWLGAKSQRNNIQIGAAAQVV